MWAERLRPASFRGIAFGVQTADKDFGRQVITHTYPLRDRVAHEDLRRRPRSFVIEAYLVGDDVLERLAALEAALEEPGPGRLIHPYYGELDVVAMGAKTRLSSEEGRVARLQITFEQTDDEAAAPVSRINSAALLNARADQAIAALASDFRGALQLAGVADFVVDAMRANITGLAELFDSAASAFGLAGRISRAVRQLRAVLSPDPDTIAMTVAASMRSISDGRSVASADALGRVAGFGTDMPPTAAATPSRKAEAANREALITLVRSNAAIEAARAGAAVAWESRDQALQYRDVIADALDRAADRTGAAGWDASWGGLTDVRTTWIRHVIETAAPLPRLSTVRPAATLPAAVLAYQLNGDDLGGLFARADDLARRNGIRHPGFVPGGRDLEVLANG